MLRDQTPAMRLAAILASLSLAASRPVSSSRELFSSLSYGDAKAWAEHYNGSAWAEPDLKDGKLLATTPGIWAQENFLTEDQARHSPHAG